MVEIDKVSSAMYEKGKNRDRGGGLSTLTRG